MEPKSLREPERTLRTRMAAAAKLVYDRDPVLGAALDVALPPVVPSGSRLRLVSPVGPSDGRGLAYRAARRVYRMLKRMEVLRPVLEKIRREIRRRS